MTPETLAGIGWLDTVDGYIVAPSEPTCKKNSGSEGTTIDFAVLDNTLIPTVKSCELVEDDVYQPHCFVELKLKHGTFSNYETNIVTPRSFLTERPIGPVNCPANSWWDNKPPNPITIEEQAKWITNAIEQELIYVYHVDWEADKDGGSPYTGRAKGFTPPMI